MKLRTVVMASLALVFSCSPQSKQSNSENKVKLITLDPGHFHAALIQKTMYEQIDSNVYVYAPAGEDVEEHLKRIEGYNLRPDNPTNWREEVFLGGDYLQKMLDERKGNVVVLAGSNQKKTQYIRASVEAGFNVLADKPMAINVADFALLKESFEIAQQQGVLLYDIMTERSEITTMLQKEFSMDKELFGELEKGSVENPAVTKESVHHFYKFVSGAALKRPAWFFDVGQQGEGIVDVTTHLVDLIQWECFPEQLIDYNTDIEIVSARRWPTGITPSEFKEVTSLEDYPDFLLEDIQDSILNIYANGEINYRIRDIYAKVSVIWKYKAPEGTGDTHYSIMRGTKANIIIRQGADQDFKPTLYIEPVALTDDQSFSRLVKESIQRVQSKYPGVEIKKNATAWEVIVPEKYKVSHEEHFAEVTRRFLQYMKDGKLPEWEIPNMLAKYYTTTKALEIAQNELTEK